LDLENWLPATPALVIETLFHRDYIVWEKKSIISTEKGLLVYQILADKKIADVFRTVQWELAFEKMQNNVVNLIRIYNQVQQLLNLKKRRNINTNSSRCDLVSEAWSLKWFRASFFIRF